MSRANRKQADNWWSAIEQAPVPQAVSADKMRRRFRVWRWAIVALLVWTPMVTFAAMALVVQQPATGAADPAMGFQSPPGRAEATVVVENWLTSDGTPLPGGRLVSWDGAVTTPWTDTELAPSSQPPTYDVWLHSFTVSSADGIYLYGVQTRIAWSATLGAKVVGNPSLVPAAQPSSDLPVSAAWPGWTTSSPSQSVIDTVEQWVRAYTSGDATALRLAVGDPDESHAYIPLGGVSDVRTAVGESAVPDRTTVTHGTDVSLVTVSVTFLRDGVFDDTREQPGAAVFDLDLLVEGASTAAARVVAWGGPGSGVLLTPYMNAVPTDRAGAGLAPVPSASPAAPTPTPLPEMSPTPDLVEGS